MNDVRVFPKGRKYYENFDEIFGHKKEPVQFPTPKVICADDYSYLKEIYDRGGPVQLRVPRRPEQQPWPPWFEEALKDAHRHKEKELEDAEHQMADLGPQQDERPVCGTAAGRGSEDEAPDDKTVG